MDRAIIGLGYKARSGKDLTASILCNEYGFKQLSFASPLKASVQALFGFTDEQVYGDQKSKVDPFWNDKLSGLFGGIDITPGFLLQYCGTDLFRNNLSVDVHVLRLKRTLDENAETNYVVSDVRFPNEADMIASEGGLVIRVDRDLPPLVGRDANHPSETAMDEYVGWDYILDNNGTLQHLKHGINRIISNEFRYLL